MARTLTTAPGRPAVELLRQLIAEAKGGDPLAPVTVAVPSGFCGLSLRRLLAAATGLVNVRFLPLPEVAELLGAPALAATGRRPLPPPVRAEAIRAAVAADPGPLASVAAHPATERSVERALDDLRACDDATLQALAAANPRTEALVRVRRAVRRRLAGNWYDAHDLAHAAAEVARRGTAARAELGPVLVYAPLPMAPMMAPLVDALEATVVAHDLGGPPPATAIVSAPDPDEEVHTALRLVMTRARSGTPLHRMALLYPVERPYARLVAQQLASAAIPSNGPSVQPLSATVAGVTLLGLLALPDRDWRRDDVVAWLAAAPVVDRDGRAVPAARWDAVSRRAGVVAGRQQWQDRLRHRAAEVAEERRARAARAGVGDGPADEGQADDTHVLDAELDDLRHLERFVAELAAALEPPGAGTWSALAGWAGALVDRVLGPVAGPRAWPEPEREALDAVRAGLAELAVLDTLGPRADLNRFRRAVERQLDAPTRRSGRFGDGVFVGPLPSAAGLDLDLVVVLGLGEGLLPRRPPVDALLPDAERQRAGGALATSPLEDQRRHLLAALSTATGEKVLSVPRADPGGARTVLPSRWLLEAASALAGGSPVYGGHLARLSTRDPRVTHVPSFEAGLAQPAEPASLHDHDLASLLRWSRAGGSARDHILATELPRLAAGLDGLAARQSPAFTRFDGRVPVGAVRPPGTDQPLSPTSLEHYATCPFRYLVQRVLRVGALDRPEEVVRLGAAGKGSLVHAVLQRYVEGRLGGRGRSLDDLLAIAEEIFTEEEAAGRTGKPLLWRYDRAVIRRELQRFYDEDHLEPVAAELPFGVDDEEPVTVILEGGRPVHFRGYADRVDRDGDGTLVVTDYKTGGRRGYEDLEDDAVARGTKLQLPLYGLAAHQRHGRPDEPVRARYWFISERGQFRERGYSVDDERLGQFTEVVSTIVGGIEAGRFPARPGEADWRGGWDNCRYCHLDRLCPSDRDRQWSRQRQAPELADYVALAEGDL